MLQICVTSQLDVTYTNNYHQFMSLARPCQGKITLQHILAIQGNSGLIVFKEDYMYPYLPTLPDFPGKSRKTHIHPGIPGNL